MPFGRLRQRLDRLEAEASETMSSAQVTLQAFKILGETATEMVNEILDGVRVKVIREDDSTILDFLSGKTKELSFGLAVKLREPEDNAT
jgi:hypothetical protein